MRTLAAIAGTCRVAYLGAIHLLYESYRMPDGGLDNPFHVLYIQTILNRPGLGESIKTLHLRSHQRRRPLDARVSARTQNLKKSAVAYFTTVAPLGLPGLPNLLDFQDTERRVYKHWDIETREIEHLDQVLLILCPNLEKLVLETECISRPFDLIHKLHASGAISPLTNLTVLEIRWSQDFNLNAMFNLEKLAPNLHTLHLVVKHYQFVDMLDDWCLPKGIRVLRIETPLNPMCRGLDRLLQHCPVPKTFSYVSRWRDDENIYRCNKTIMSILVPVQHAALTLQSIDVLVLNEQLTEEQQRHWIPETVERIVRDVSFDEFAKLTSVVINKIRII